MAAEENARERALQARTAVANPDTRRQLAEDAAAISTELEGLLRLVLKPDRLPATRLLAESADCASWYQTAAACYALAAVRSDDGWRETGDACATMGQACEALASTL